MSPRDVEYSNPIVPGFAPDPSVVHVNGTFFLCNSSFHVFPGLPVYASKDLKEWTHIGNALNRHSQLELNCAFTAKVPLDTGFSMVASMGIVAPSIHYHEDTFYIITSRMAIIDGQWGLTNFILSTKDIWSNEWSDPVFFEFNGMDVSLFFEDGRTYVQGGWSLGRDKHPMTTIYQVEIDINTGKLLSEAKEIWGGWARHDTEGPHLYKKDGYYYLVVAEGGTFEHHMLSVARSKDIWGPYEAWEHNPMMTADGTDEYIQNIGHGALFQDLDQRWWAAVLGVRKQANGTLGLGRESFLSPVDWPEGGWPTVRQPKMAFTREYSPKLVKASPPFKTPALVEDLYIRHHDASCYSYADDGKAITLLPSRTDFTHPVETCTFLGRRQRTLDSEASALLRVPEKASGKPVVSGIALYKDPVRFASIGYDFEADSLIFKTFNSATNLSGLISRQLSAKVTQIAFRITATSSRYTFEAKLTFAEEKVGSEKDWIEMGSIDTRSLDARDYTGPIFGVFAHAGLDEGLLVPVTLEDFKVQAIYK